MSFIWLVLYLITMIMRPQDWVSLFFRFPIVDVLVFLTAFTIIIEKVLSKKGFVKVPQAKLMYGLYVAVIMSHAVHLYVGGMIFSFQSFLVLFVLFFLILNGIDSEFKFKVMIWLIIIQTVILVPQGIYQVQHGYGWAGQQITINPHVLGEVRINWVGIFNDPNDLALLFVVSVGLLLPFIFGRSVYIQRLLSVFLVGMLFYGIYLTNSRGGLLALMATVFFYFVRQTRRFALGGLIGGLVAVTIFALGPSRLWLISAGASAAYGRIELWYEGILMLKSNPLFGVGYGMFMEDVPQTAHNSFILAAAELGMVGLFFWMGLIYSSFKSLSLIQEKVPHLRTYALGLQSALIGFCAAAFFLSRTYVILPYILFALSGALLFVCKQKNQDLDVSFTKKDAKTTFKFSLAVVFLAWVLIKIGI